MSIVSAPAVRGLLAEPALRLSCRLAGDGLDVSIDWVHSSDLSDPAPFLDGRTMLLTTGTQFPADTASPGTASPGTAGADTASPDDDYYDRYVNRLVEAGVVAIGFGLEVIREGTPESLVRACAARGLTLVEVPYEVPFIALIRWVADRISARDRERDAWTLRAQRAVSVAALTTGTLTAVARALAEQVEGGVVVQSASGQVTLEELAFETPAGTAAGRQALVDQGLRMLARATRSSAEVALPDWSGFATVQTLGGRGALRGTLAVVGRGRNDVATQAVVTGAVAIAEVLLGYGDAERRMQQRLGGSLVRLLVDGDQRAATALADEFGFELADLVRVGVVDVPELTHAARARLVETLSRDDLARVDEGPRRLVFVTSADPQRFASTPGFADLVIALSAPVPVSEAKAGLAQAMHVLAQDRPPGVSVFGDGAGALLDDLWSPAASGLARRKLAALDGEPGDLLQCSRVWLAHNGHWESASREIGLHRHTLKARIARVGTLLELDFDEFSGRAELWALLRAAGA